MKSSITINMQFDLDGQKVSSITTYKPGKRAMNAPAALLSALLKYSAHRIDHKIFQETGIDIRKKLKKGEKEIVDRITIAEFLEGLEEI